MLLAFVAVAPGLWNETKNHQCSHQCSCRAQLAQNRGNFVIWLTHSNRFQLLWRLAWLHSPYAFDAVPTGLSRSNEPQVPSIYHQQKVMINQWIWDVQYYPQQVEPLDFCQTCQFITVAWKGSIYPRVHMGPMQWVIHSNFPYVQIASKTLSEEFITSSISSGSKHELTVLFPTCRKKWFAVCRLAFGFSGPPCFLKKTFHSISAQRLFFWRSKGVQGETVGNSRRLHPRPAKKTCFYTMFKHFSWTHATK